MLEAKPFHTDFTLFTQPSSLRQICLVAFAVPSLSSLQIKGPSHTSIVCFIDLDQGGKMIIFKSILTTFIESVIFRGCWFSSKNCLKLKIEPPQANLA
jgi:hypothetical protein